MKIFVISLKNSPRRKSFFEKNNTINENIVLIDAIPGKNITHDIRNKICDRNSIKKRYNRDLLDNEIACFLSHIEAWREIFKSGTAGIIVEDDAILTKEFDMAENTLKEFNAGEPTAILLGHSKLEKNRSVYHYFKNPIKKKFIDRNFEIGKPFKYWTSGMVGYYINPSCAERLVKSNDIIRCVSDDWSYHAQKGINVYEIRPYVVYEDFKNTESSMEKERREIANYRGSISNLLLEPLRIARALIRNIRTIKR